MQETDRRQQILEGALRTFSRDGYHKATIKGIADEADIRSPALIYHYFDNKRALLEAIIDDFAPLQGTPLTDPDTAEQWRDLPPEILLPQLMGRVLSLRDDPTIMRLIRIYFSEAVRNEDVAAAVGNFQQRALAFLESYLQRQIELGRLRPHDVPSSARMLVGTMIAYVLGAEIFPAVAASFPEREPYAAAVFDVLMHGLRAESFPEGEEDKLPGGTPVQQEKDSP